MKTLLITITLSFAFVSCSHLDKVNSTDKKNIIEVRFADANHEPKIGQKVKVFNWVSKSYNKGFKNSYAKGWVKENEVEGKIVEVLSNELIRVELEDDFLITQKSFAEY